MTRPWKTLETVQTREGALELKQRGEKDFLITIAGRILMTSSAHRSEQALGTVACKRLAGYARPRVLVGGLGMGFTLRAVLDELPPTATVLVAELNPVVLAWCQGPLAGLTLGAASDPRVKVEIIDVAKAIDRAAAGPKDERFDAIVIDLYVGPDAGTKKQDPLYGTRAVAQARTAITAGGVYAIWGEAPDAAYMKRLEGAGFKVRHERPGHGGLKHVVYVAQAT
jgi:spermidine synthase